MTNLKTESQSDSKLESGSVEYIADHRIDKVLKELKDDIKHAIALSDEKLTKTKKAKVVEAAKKLDSLGYPKDEICTRLSKTLKGLVNDRTVRDALDKYPQYKNLTKMAEASAQGQDHGRGRTAATMGELKNKPLEQLTLDDLKSKELGQQKLKTAAVYFKKVSDAKTYHLKSAEDTIKELETQLTNRGEQVKARDILLLGAEKIISELPKINQKHVEKWISLHKELKKVGL